MSNWLNALITPAALAAFATDGPATMAETIAQQKRAERLTGKRLPDNERSTAAAVAVTIAPSIRQSRPDLTPADALAVACHRAAVAALRDLDRHTEAADLAGDGSLADALADAVADGAGIADRLQLAPLPTPGERLTDRTAHRWTAALLAEDFAPLADALRREPSRKHTPGTGDLATKAAGGRARQQERAAQVAALADYADTLARVRAWLAYDGRHRAAAWTDDAARLADRLAERPADDPRMERSTMSAGDTSTSGPASLPALALLERTDATGRPWHPITTEDGALAYRRGPGAPLLAVRLPESDAWHASTVEAVEYALAHQRTLPPFQPTATDRRADRLATGPDPARTVPTAGTVRRAPGITMSAGQPVAGYGYTNALAADAPAASRPAASRKRKRDGAIGGSMTRA